MDADDVVGDCFDWCGGGSVAGAWYSGRPVINWYQHLFDTGGTSKYLSLFCIPMGTVASKGELWIVDPEKTLEIG